MATPTDMLTEARIDLAFLARFADRMADSPEGAIYLRLLNQTAHDAISWAITHCPWETAA